MIKGAVIFAAGATAGIAVGILIGGIGMFGAIAKADLEKFERAGKLEGEGL